MRKRTSFYDFTIYEFTNWRDIHKASKWPIGLLRNNHRRPIFSIRIPFDIKRKSRIQKPGLKQFMIKQPAIGQQSHRYFMYSNSKSEIIIDNDIFQKW